MSGLIYDRKAALCRALNDLRESQRPHIFNLQLQADTGVWLKKSIFTHCFNCLKPDAYCGHPTLFYTAQLLSKLHLALLGLLSAMLTNNIGGQFRTTASVNQFERVINSWLPVQHPLAHGHGLWVQRLSFFRQFIFITGRVTLVFVPAE